MISEDSERAMGLTIRELVIEIRSDLRLLNEKIDRIDREGPTGISKQMQDHENRIRGLERKVWVASGAAMAVGGTVGAVAQSLIGG